ncbi:unnamed protein product [Lactuca saligna]|uniref:Cell division cycle protein 123 homolog n=1 Tax=Lactuca saligna TaxID=75948 RepID=A0AA36A3D5_LACSI|nr:unnamed protein product [Lactuca saligna]
MKEEEVNRCQIQEWYPKFKYTTIKTIIHELPESFIQYLLDDSEQESDDESEQLPLPPLFPELESQINESIKTLGCAIFPKLNWTSPKDSAWINSTGTLKCTSFIKISILLKSSDSLLHDLCHVHDLCNDCNAPRPDHFFLALQKWYPSLHPEMEFRCFVRNHILVGISQREVTWFYSILIEKKHELETGI